MHVSKCIYEGWKNVHINKQYRHSVFSTLELINRVNIYSFGIYMSEILPSTPTLADVMIGGGGWGLSITVIATFSFHKTMNCCWNIDIKRFEVKNRKKLGYCYLGTEDYIPKFVIKLIFIIFLKYGRCWKVPCTWSSSFSPFKIVFHVHWAVSYLSDSNKKICMYTSIYYVQFILGHPAEKWKLLCTMNWLSHWQLNLSKVTCRGRTHVIV